MQPVSQNYIFINIGRGPFNHISTVSSFLLSEVVTLKLSTMIERFDTLSNNLHNNVKEQKSSAHCTTARWCVISPIITRRGSEYSSGTHTVCLLSNQVICDPIEQYTLLFRDQPILTADDEN